MGICSPLEVHLSLCPPVCGPVTLTCLQSPEHFLSSGLLRASSYWGLVSFITYYANDWKGTNIPHVSGWLMGALHLFYSLILSYIIFNIFPHPVKVLRQGKQFSRQTPIVCRCLKAYSITCYNLITFPQRLPGTELLFCPGVERFLYFDRVSFLYLFTGGVLL